MRRPPGRRIIVLLTISKSIKEGCAVEATSPKVSDIHDCIGTLIHIARMHHRNIDRIGTQAGLNRSPCMLLLYLNERGELPSQVELASHFDISPACIARTVKALSADGLIERAEAAEDPRRNRIAITDQGRDRANEIGRRFAAFDRRAFDGFTAAELDRFHAFLQRIEQNLRRAECEADTKGSV
ncbi:MAG: MarR family transcriptional regulator [Clostridiales bacterium]|nr:MarR family transcriptional regulator [Clostridiales bacterium]